MTATTEITDKELDGLLDMLNESTRLHRLTNQELVAECNEYDAADLLIVQEMMSRLDPHWADEETEAICGY